jgi:hypothetical protein
MTEVITEEQAKAECIEIADSLFSGNPEGLEIPFTRGRAVGKVVLSSEAETGRTIVHEEVGSFDYHREVTWMFADDGERPAHASSDGPSPNPGWKGLLSTMRMIRPGEGQVVDDKKEGE